MAHNWQVSACATVCAGVLRRYFPQLLLAATALLTLAPGAAQAQPPTPAAATVLDGPSAAIDTLSGISVARDGTGGIVYLKDVDGAAHVFVTRLAGSFQAPERVDGPLGGASSQPVIAAGRGGLLLIAFVNGGRLYTVVRAGTTAPYGAPAVLAAGAGNPAISITNLSKAYLAFTASGAGGHDVRCAYYVNGRWGIEPGALDAAAGDDAGTGSGRPAVAASGDGIGIVAWGEAGHVYTRRVSQTSPSVVFEQADVPSLNGWQEDIATSPAIGTGGDSSYAEVAFRETFSSGAQQQQRVLGRRLDTSSYDGISQADGLGTPGAEGADQPAVAVGEYGEGFVTSERTSSNQLFAMRLKSNETANGVTRIDTLANGGAPFAAPASAGYHDALIAWQEQDPLTGSTEVRERFYDGGALWPEQVLSSPTLGPVDAADGLLAAGDIAADGVVAWLQGPSGSRALVAAQMYQPPGSFRALSRSAYARTVVPLLSWSASQESWGPLRYIVSVDGRQVGQTTATSIRVPVALEQGSHSWQVTAVNSTGASRSTSNANVFVDTIAPSLHARLTGRRVVGSRLHLHVGYSDTASVARADASGVKDVQVNWGVGKRQRIGHDAYHTFLSPRVYRITITVTDRAGNRRTVRLQVRITGAGTAGSGHRAH